MFNQYYRLYLKEKEELLKKVQDNLQHISSKLMISFSFSFEKYSVKISPYGVSFYALVGNDMVYVSPAFIPFIVRVNLLLELSKELKGLLC